MRNAHLILASNGYSPQSIAEVMQLPEEQRRAILAAHVECGDKRGKCGLEIGGMQPLAGSHRYPWAPGVKGNRSR